MTIFLNASTLVNSANFNLNTDILETNLINIIILIVLLVQFVGSFLLDSLASRKQKILDNINDAEKRLEEAKNRFTEANKQLAQTKIAIDKIVNELELTKVNIIKTGANNIYQELLSQIQTSKSAILLQEQKLSTQIKQQIIALTLKRIITKLEQVVTFPQQVVIIDKSIKRLGGRIKYE